MPDVTEQLREWSKSLGRAVDPTGIEQVKSPMTVGNASFAGSRRWFAVAASIVLIATGIFAVVSLGNDDPDQMSSATNPPPTVVASTTAAPQPTTAESTTPPTSEVAVVPTTQTTSLVPASVPSTTNVPTSQQETNAPLVESPNDFFVTVSGDRAVIDLRLTVGGVATYDLTCPPDRDCVVQSARVMGDAIWVAITDTEPGAPDTVVGSRVVSVSTSTGEVVEHLSLDGPAAVQTAGRGADGVIYAHLAGPPPTERQLVAVEQGEARVIESGVSGFRLSDDGRLLAVGFSNPSEGEYARFEITNLLDGTTTGFETLYINAGPAAWSPDGRYLVVNEQWEQRTAWVLDPWSGSGEPIPGTERILDGACFMSDQVLAHRTWNVGYGQGDAQPGVVRLTDLTDGSTVAEIGDSLFGDGFRCHPDGSISYLRRPVVEVELSPGLTQLEPDYDAPVELVHIAPDGSTSIVASGDLRMV